MARCPPVQAHQLSGTFSGFPGPLRVSASISIHQYIGGMLPEQAGWGNLQVSLPSDTEVMGLLCHPQHHTRGNTSAGHGKCHCRRCQQGRPLHPRTCCLNSFKLGCIHVMGDSRDRRLCHNTEQEMPPVLQPRGQRPEIFRGQPPLRLEGKFLYMFPPLPLIPQVLQKFKREQPRCILVTPWWSRCIWFSTLLHLSGRRYLFIRETPTPRDSLLQYPRHLKLTAWLLG